MSKRDSAVRLAWVIVDGVSRHVSDFADLEKADRPQAQCSNCESQLVLKLGDVRAHHAAHRSGVICATASSEGALHMNVKMYLWKVLQGASRILVTQPCSCVPGRECAATRRQVWASDWSEVTVEHRLGQTRPDIVLQANGRAVAAIEVFASNRVSREKARLLAGLRIPWLEVRAQDIETTGESAWTPSEVLPADQLGPPNFLGTWRCEDCERRFQRLQSQTSVAGVTAQSMRANAPGTDPEEIAAEIRRDHEERRRRLEQRRKQMRETQVIGTRLVDYYFPSGFFERREFLSVRRLEGGEIKAYSLRESVSGWKGPEVPHPLTQRQRDRLEGALEEAIVQHVRVGVIVDRWPWRRVSTSEAVPATPDPVERGSSHPRFKWDQERKRWKRVALSKGGTE